MTAPLRQPTGDTHRVGGVEWRRSFKHEAWFAVAHGWVLHVEPRRSGGVLWATYPLGPKVQVRRASSPAHAMRNAVQWAHRNPVTHRPAVARARAVFEGLVG